MLVYFLILIIELAWKWLGSVENCSRFLYFNENVAMLTEAVVVFIVCIWYWMHNRMSPVKVHKEKQVLMGKHEGENTTWKA